MHRLPQVRLALCSIPVLTLLGVPAFGSPTSPLGSPPGPPEPNANHCPVVSPITNKTVAEASGLSFTPSATDADGDQLTYSAIGLPSGATVSASTGTFSWTPDYGQSGVYSVTFLVSDTQGCATPSNPFSITVSHTNRPPTVDWISDQWIAEANLLTIQPVGADPDGETIVWHGTGLPSGATVSASTGSFVWTPSYTQAGYYPNVSLVATDPNGATGSASFAISVDDVNRPPVVASITSQIVAEAATLTVTPSASDPDADPLSWSGSGLPTGSSVASGTGVFLWTPSNSQSGIYSGVTLIAMDPSGATGSSSFTITVTNTNAAPVVAHIANRSIPENSLLTVTPSASDVDGDPLTWSASGLPSGASVNPATGVFTWRPGFTDAGSYPGVTLTATDPFAASSSATFSITVTNTAQATGVGCPASALFGTPSTAYSLPGDPSAPLTIDLNRDGLLDVVSLDYTNRAVTVMLGQSASGVQAGAFAPSSTYLTGFSRGVQSMVAGDFTGDGVSDLVVLGDDSLLTVMAGSLGGSFAHGPLLPAFHGMFSLAVGDIDGDGILDIVAPCAFSYCQGQKDSAAVVLVGQGNAGRGNGTFAAPVLVPLGLDPQALRLVDINGDGLLDILSAGQIVTQWQQCYGYSCNGSYYNGYYSCPFRYGSTITTRFGRGDGTFEAIRQTSHPASWWSPYLAVKDVNGDDIPDIVGLYSGQEEIWLGNGAAARGDGTYRYSTPVPGSSGFYPGQPVVGDVNGDGIPDVVVQTVSDSLPAVGVFLGLGASGVPTGLFAQPVRYPVSSARRGVISGDDQLVLADMNADGGLDVVANIYTPWYSPTLSVLYNACADAANLPPRMDGVHDVMGDQGGRVLLTWKRSSLDTPGARKITSYRIWRRVPIAPSTNNLASTGRDAPFRMVLQRGSNGEAQTSYWEAVAVQPAGGLAGYGYVAATTQDSVAASNPLTGFFVSALTADPFVYYDSQPDSGYSVDNLAPSAPQGLIGQYQSSNALKLHWRQGSEADLAQYAVYRSSDPTFPTQSTTRVIVADTLFIDSAWTPSSHYRVTAQDVHGNESVPTPLAPEAIATVPSGQTRNGYGLRLLSNAGGSIALEVTIATPGPVTVAISDVRGRTFRTLLSGLQQAGTLRLGWDGRDAAGNEAGRGVYIVQLNGGTTTLASKVLRTE